jgi:hypothetical protein
MRDNDTLPAVLAILAGTIIIAGAIGASLCLSSMVELISNREPLCRLSSLHKRVSKVNLFHNR